LLVTDQNTANSSNEMIFDNNISLWPRLIHLQWRRAIDGQNW